MQKDNKESATDTALKYCQFFGSLIMLEDLTRNITQVITFFLNDTYTV
jgi:hypothetical protein